MKQAQLSRKTLCGYLYLLRDLMVEKTNFPPKQVIFFNSRSLYLYLVNRPCGGSTVGEILRTIEHCIPLAFTMESISLFLDACEEVEREDKALTFMESSKADFLLLLGYSAQDKERWDSVLALCDQLRQQNQPQGQEAEKTPFQFSPLF